MSRVSQTSIDREQGCCLAAEPPSSLPAEPHEVHCVLHDGVVTFVGSATTLVTGLPPEHFHGMHVSEVVHPDDLRHVERFMAPGWTGEISVTFRVQDIEGRWRWRSARGVRAAGPPGQYSAVVVLRDADPPGGASPA